MIETGKKSSQSIELDKLTKDDVIMLNYTSGTTGAPKGVKIHAFGAVVNCVCALHVMDCDHNDTLVSYLPSPHAFDQIMFGIAVMIGARVGYYHGDTLKLTEDCQVLKPTVFPSVPRLYNKIFAQIQGGFSKLTGCKKWLADKAVASKTYYLNKDASYHHGCYDSLIFGKVQKLLGGQMRFMVTASAPISKEVLDMMKIAFACPVIEAYGLSETLGGSNLTLPNDPISGTVGGPCLTYTMKLKDLPHMDYRLTDKPFPRGEILIGGPGNFRGYFNNPEKTAEMLDQDGFVHTGDVGVLYPNGSVKILDRSKNIFKLAQGEYLAPEKLENIYI